MNQKSNHFELPYMNPSLTSFRAFAVLAVFFFHVDSFNAGYLGVQGFFVLSGFLLTPILLSMKEGKTSYRRYFVTFLGRRLLRILPLYFFYLLVLYLLIVYVFLDPQDQYFIFLHQFKWAATFSYNFLHASDYYHHSYFLTHFWSLANEEQFYLIWPFFIFFISGEYIKKLLILCIALGPLCRVLIAYLTSNQAFPILIDSVDVAVYVLPFSYVDSFAIGAYFALYKTEVKAKTIYFIVVGTVFLGVLTEYLYYGDVNFLGLGYLPLMGDSYKYIWGYSLVSLAFAYILVGLQQRVFARALFENNIIVYLGSISYGMYVYHYAVIWFVYEYFPRMPDFPKYSLNLIALIITILISSLSYEVIEKRFIRLKDTFFPKV